MMPTSNPLPATVSVSTTARLHLGFLDMAGTLGRRFGSLGVAIEAFRTSLSVCKAPSLEAFGPQSERAARGVRRLAQALGVSSDVSVRVHESIPGHAGLGSGTQLSLALGAALSHLHGLNTDTAELAGILQRGARSGIGVGSFDQGGFLMDGGRGEFTVAPPVISRLDFPEQWRILLIMDARAEGLHGKQEVAAFQRLPAFPESSADRLCRIALMQILPALTERQLTPFAQGIAELQRVVGDHFAPAQGGRFTSDAVADALGWAESEGFPGIGQSSWGPTGFVLTEGQSAADELQQRFKRRYGELSPLRFLVTKGCNRGSRITLGQSIESLRKVN